MGLFDEPDDAGGNGPRLYPKDILGHLLLVWAIEYIEHSPTQYTKPGQASDVVTVDVVDLADQLGQPVKDPETGEDGFLVRRSWWRQNHLIKMLKLKLGNTNPLLVTMSKGAAGVGRNAPFQLVSMTGNEAAVAMANAWLQAHPDFTPSKPMPKFEPREETPGDPWADQPSPTLPPARPAVQPTPAQATVLERLAQQSQQGRAAWGQKDQGQVPF